MIVSKRPDWHHVIFITRGSIIKRIYPQLLLVTILSLLVVGLHQVAPSAVPVFNGAPFALLGVVLSVFLGFRNSACYDRWWEARKHWGVLVSSSRDLARQSLLLEERGEAAAGKRRELLFLAAVFAYALVDHLREGSRSTESVSHLLPEDHRTAFEGSSNCPASLLLRIGQILARLRAHGSLSDYEYGMMDATLGHMNSAQSACERVRNTPVPLGYTVLLHRTAYIFCFLVPFGFADVLGWTTPIAAAVFAYTFFGLDALGDELEEPFGNLPNDLPIHSLAVTIDRSLRGWLGEADLPQPPVPSGHVLM
jgi:putative membrane protein